MRIWSLLPGVCFILLVGLFVGIFNMKPTILLIHPQNQHRQYSVQYDGSKFLINISESEQQPSNERGFHLILQFPIVLNDSMIMRWRQSEYIETLQRNLDHPLVLQVHILNENPSDEQFIKDLNLHQQNKLTYYNIGQRMRYSDAFRYASTELRHQIVMIINADCYVGKGFELIQPKLLQTGTLYALTRRETAAAVENCKSTDFCGNNSTYIGSHDAFMFYLRKHLPKRLLSNINLRANIAGVEKVLIYNLRTHGRFRVRNPCRFLHIIHNHCSQIRNIKTRFVSGKRIDKFLGFNKIPFIN